MKEIAYISRPRDLVFDDDVVAILRRSQQRNRAYGLTGLLLYDGDSFLQVLEGEAGAVDALYAAIRADTRHQDVETVADGTVRRRAFSSWSMRYQRVDDLMDLIGLQDGPRRDGGFGRALAEATAGPE